MKILIELTAVSKDAPEPAPCVRQGHNLELAPGFFINIAICDESIRVHTNKDTVSIPFAELLELVKKHHPAIMPLVAKKPK